ncbi:MAG: hypothetical protein A3F43_03660 [Gammaproteobacteria bacterium RIFCSPHIGHO2_12_FULL_42_10]|nr:MAG: hypothetical protein A3F43_03660 [Gammaproteobacteria bacterium RIFCSPHIGHO2_12_FULL_42_10]
MFDRLQKPFLTVETGEAYQPIRLTYDLDQTEGVAATLEKLSCLQKNPTPNSWSWYWKEECDDLHFESLNSFRKNLDHPVRLGTVTLRNNKLFLNLPSFKRACMAVPFFHKMIAAQIAHVHHADFINKVFALDERLPHGFTELFKDEELDHLLHQRIEDYHKVQTQCENASSAEEALSILSQYTHTEAKKRLPYAERYVFQIKESDDLDVVFLGFYIYLRGRELVAIKRWFGEAGYSLADAADETIEAVFGGMGIDIIE